MPFSLTFLSFFPIFPILFSSPAPPRLPLPSMFSEFPLSRATSQPSLLSRFISFFRHPPLRHVRTHVLPVSLSLSLFLPLFPVPTTKNVANVRIDRSLSRVLPPFFTLLPSARAHSSSICPCSSPFSTSSFTSSSSTSTFSATLSTLPSDLLYHIRHQHYTRALISSVGNSAFLAISLLLCHPLAPSPTLSPPAPSLPRAPPRFLRLSIPTSPAHRIVYALRSTRLGYGCLISLCHTQGARIRRQFLEVNFAAIEYLDSRDRDENRNCAVCAHRYK